MAGATPASSARRAAPRSSCAVQADRRGIDRHAMAHRSLRDAVIDLERAGQLVRVRDEVDPSLEMAAVQRRVYAAGGPAVLFENVAGCGFPAVCNLYGTLDRCRFLFRHTIAR